MNCIECQDSGWITVPAYPVDSIDSDCPIPIFPIQVKCPYCERGNENV